MLAFRYTTPTSYVEKQRNYQRSKTMERNSLYCRLVCVAISSNQNKYTMPTILSHTLISNSLPHFAPPRTRRDRERVIIPTQRDSTIITTTTITKTTQIMMTKRIEVALNDKRTTQNKKKQDKKYTEEGGSGKRDKTTIETCE